jgi:hypothetical protein
MTSKSTAIYFVHGFAGGSDTWGDLAHLMRTDADLSNYEAVFFNYPTSLNPFYTALRYFWKDDPPIETVGRELRTRLDCETAHHRRLMLVGHSMGGLVIQSFILNELRLQRHVHLDRLTEVILFGSPSGGLGKARWGSFLKGQIGDMSTNGTFIRKLTSAWEQLVCKQLDDHRDHAPDLAEHVYFRCSVVVGDQDRFVGESSPGCAVHSCEASDVIPGDHVEMVKFKQRTDSNYRYLKSKILRGTLTRAELEPIMRTEEGLRELDGYIDSISSQARARDPKYVAKPANENDIHWICHKAGGLYGSDVALPTDVKSSWLRKNPNAFWKILELKSQRPVGSLEILPITPRGLEKLRTGEITEAELTADDICPPEDMAECKALYWENLMVVDDAGETLIFAFKACLDYFPTIIEKMGVTDIGATMMCAMPVVSFTTARGKRTSNSERILKKLSFTGCGTTKQGFPFYQAELQAVLKRLGCGQPVSAGSRAELDLA